MYYAQHVVCVLCPGLTMRGRGLAPGKMGAVHAWSVGLVCEEGLKQRRLEGCHLDPVPPVLLVLQFYMLSALIKGTESYCCEDCLDTVVAGGVKLHFQVSSHFFPHVCPCVCLNILLPMAKWGWGVGIMGLPRHGGGGRGQAALPGGVLFELS